MMNQMMNQGSSSGKTRRYRKSKPLQAAVSTQQSQATPPTHQIRLLKTKCVWRPSAPFCFKGRGWEGNTICFFFFIKKNKTDPPDQRAPILSNDARKHISWVEFHGGSSGTIKIQLGFQNPPVIRDNSCQIKIFEKILKNVFYVEFHGESNGAIHSALRDRNPLQNLIFQSLDSITACFLIFEDN